MGRVEFVLEENKENKNITENKKKENKFFV